MVEAQLLILFLILHFLGDWLFQPRRIATRKSREPKALAKHMIIYGLFMCGLLYVMPWDIWFVWFGLNIVVHTAQDWYWYRIAPVIMSWPDDNPVVNNWIWVAVGFDQLLHYLMGIMTYVVLVD